MNNKNFLEDLKKAVESEDSTFNSDAAKKINEINKRADQIKKDKSENEIKESVSKRVEDSGVKKVDKEKVSELNSEYHEKMKQRAKEETILATIATLGNMENQIDKDIQELYQFVEELKAKYNSDDEDCGELYEKINELSDKYKLYKKE